MLVEMVWRWKHLFFWGVGGLEAIQNAITGVLGGVFGEMVNIFYFCSRKGGAYVLVEMLWRW